MKKQVRGGNKGGRPELTRHTGFSQFKKANTKPKVCGNPQSTH